MELTTRIDQLDGQELFHAVLTATRIFGAVCLETGKAHGDTWPTVEAQARAQQLDRLMAEVERRLAIVDRLSAPSAAPGRTAGGPSAAAAGGSTQGALIELRKPARARQNDST